MKAHIWVHTVETWGMVAKSKETILTTDIVLKFDVYLNISFSVGSKAAIAGSSMKRLYTKPGSSARLALCSCAWELLCTVCPNTHLETLTVSRHGSPDV